MTDNIDFTYLKTVSGGDEAFELSLIESLIAEIDQKMVEMQNSISGSDTDGVRLHAHSLKNLYGILGIATLKDQFFVFEKNSIAISPSSLQHPFVQCQNQWTTSKSVLSTVMANYKARLS